MPFIKVNQTEIFYYDNNLEGIPLVFIHGWLGSSLEWCYQLYHFDSKNHIIFLDLPGFGKSDNPNNEFSVEFFAQQIVDLLELLGYNEIILIGHSLGGLIAQSITVKNPKLVKKLILISSTAAISPLMKEKFMIFWINILFRLFYKSFLKRILNQIISREEENREYKKLYNKTLQLPKATVLRSFKNMTSKFNLKNQLTRISQPTLVIYGSGDKIISKSMINDLNDLIPISELNVIENGSHRAMYDNHEKVNQLIEDFITK